MTTVNPSKQQRQQQQQQQQQRHGRGGYTASATIGTHHNHTTTTTNMTKSDRHAVVPTTAGSSRKVVVTPTTTTNANSSGAGGAAGSKFSSSTAVATAAVTTTTTRKQNINITITNNSPSHVDKEIVDELLLVCGVIGSSTAGSIGGMDDDDVDIDFVPVTDCLNWLQDLQRVLRRDDDTYRSISLLLGQWKIVPHKLLPLVVHCQYDTAIVLTVCKVLVLLTKPLSDSTIHAAQMIIDPKKYAPEVIAEQIALRDNAIQQMNTLIEYKRIFCHHQHYKSNTKKKNKKDNRDGNSGTGTTGGTSGGIMSIFVSLLAEPLSRTGSSRTDHDHLTIELVLHLFRNLLSIEPVLYISSSMKNVAVQLQYEIITLFEKELVLDIILVLAADIELRENTHYNLLLMELLHYLFKNQDPISVASVSVAASSSSSSTTTTMNMHHNSTNTMAALSSSATKRTARNNKQEPGPLRIPPPPPTAGRITEQLCHERQRQAAAATARHSHFGGTLRFERTDGKAQYVSAALALGQQQHPPGHSSTTYRKKNKKSEPFIGATSSIYQWHTSVKYRSNKGAGVAKDRAMHALNRFCEQFVQKSCYGPVMKSLKNEFRRDSVRLEENDITVFFRITWFINQWYRMSRHTKTDNNGRTTSSLSENNSNSSIGPLIFTMDLFMFNLVYTSIETFQTTKKHAKLAQSVALLSEMMHLLHAMYTSKEHTEHVMAIGLLDRLFYGDEPLDNLSKLIQRWTQSTNTREYVCDVFEICYMTFKLLDANAKACRNKEKEENQDDDGDDDNRQQKHDAVSKWKAIAAQFDVGQYFARKIVSNQFVVLCTTLLSQYAVNAPHVNHRIIAMLLRMCKHVLLLPDDSTTANNPLVNKTVTFEPMLYNINLFIVLNIILNDTIIRKDKDYATVLSFASSIVSNFATASQDNPMLFVEVLFKHPLPHRYCDFVTNQYVTEELRMVVDRQILREEDKRLRMLTTRQHHDNDNDDDEEERNEEQQQGTGDYDSEEELEFISDYKKKKQDQRDKIISSSSIKKAEEVATTTSASIDSNGDPGEENESIKNPLNDDDDDDDMSDTSEASDKSQLKAPADNNDYDDDALQDSDDDDGTNFKKSTEPKATMPTNRSKKRLRKLNDVDRIHFEDNDNDDEEEDGIFTGSTNGPTTKKKRSVIMDDDEED